MRSATENTGGTPRLTLEGELNIYHAAELKTTLLQAVAEYPELEIDLAGVSDLDTSGFQLLVLAKREAEAAGHALRLIAHSPPVRDVLGLYRMEFFFGDPIVIPVDTQAGQH